MLGEQVGFHWEFGLTSASSTSTTSSDSTTYTASMDGVQAGFQWTAAQPELGELIGATDLLYDASHVARVDVVDGTHDHTGDLLWWHWVPGLETYELRNVVLVGEPVADFPVDADGFPGLAPFDVLSGEVHVSLGGTSQVGGEAVYSFR